MVSRKYDKKERQASTACRKLDLFYFEAEATINKETVYISQAFYDVPCFVWG